MKARPYKPANEAAWTRLARDLCAGCTRRALGPCAIEKKARGTSVTSPDYPTELKRHPIAGPTCGQFAPHDEPPRERCRKTLELPL